MERNPSEPGPTELSPSEEHTTPEGHGTVLNYHFPVEVHAVGALSESERAELAEAVYDRLARELAGRL
ncbi:hypothetical protein ACGFNU_00200 [Spirillospora sp. NPDC048911]|uniref:hypothetical protein n=1 Tax=Spirillospora sp. NPDC048911 TaxID=3364527 RepID=UPI003723C181